MNDADRPAVVIAWVDCASCGRIEKAAQDFNLPDDIATDMERLHFRREVKPAH